MQTFTAHECWASPTPLPPPPKKQGKNPCDFFHVTKRNSSLADCSLAQATCNGVDGTFTSQANISAAQNNQAPLLLEAVSPGRFHCFKSCHFQVTLFAWKHSIECWFQWASFLWNWRRKSYNATFWRHGRWMSGDTNDIGVANMPPRAICPSFLVFTIKMCLLMGNGGRQKTSNTWFVYEEHHGIKQKGTEYRFHRHMMLLNREVGMNLVGTNLTRISA